MNGHRNWGGSSEEHKPVTYVRGYPIYAAHLVVAVFVLSMVVTTIVVRGARSLGDTLYFTQLSFNSVAMLQGEVWRAFTYGWVNPPSLQFVIDMVMIVWFGRDVEKHVGRKIFLWLYGGMYLATPIVLTVVGLIYPMGFTGATGALAVFTAFACIYPNVTIMFNILAKWASLILIGTFTLVHFAYHNEAAMISLWVTNAYAFVFMRYQQGHLELPRIKFWHRKPKLRVLPDLPKKQVISSKSAAEGASMAEVDVLLDKIAKSGITSLTAKERAKLEAAREGLMKRSGERR